MSARWSQDLTYKFVHMYKEQDCLWDVNSPLYKDRTSRNAAISAIVDQMNLEGFGPEEVKIKIKSLRATYFGERAKIERSQNLCCDQRVRNCDEYVPPMQWFSIMDSFLKPIKPLKRNASDDEMPLSNLRSRKPRKSRALDAMMEESDVDPIGHNGSDVSPKLEIYDKNESREGGQDRTTDSEDEFDFFGKNVAMQLRGLPLELALDAQVLIQKILKNRRLKSMKRVRVDQPVIQRIEVAPPQALRRVIQIQQPIVQQVQQEQSELQCADDQPKDRQDVKARLEEYMQWH